MDMRIPVYVGLDYHQKSIQVCVMNGEGQVLGNRPFIPIYQAFPWNTSSGTLLVGMRIDDLIVRDPTICGGQPVVRDTRIPLRTILASLAEGDRIEDILRDFPTLTREAVEAIIAFAAAAAQDDLPIPGVPVLE